MKYFLILIFVLLSGMLVRANDPDIVSPNYDVTPDGNELYLQVIKSKYLSIVYLN